MSQEKVDRYKEEKANRRQIMKKQKMMNTARKAVLGVIALALVAWLGISAANTYLDNQPRKIAEINYDAIDEYLTELQAQPEE